MAKARNFQAPLLIILLEYYWYLYFYVHTPTHTYPKEPTISESLLK